MRLIDAIFRHLIGDPGDPLTLDNVPITALDCRTPDKIAAAREKLGRPFAIEIKQARKTEPSYVLEHINAQSAQRSKATVTRIDARRKSTTKEK